MPRRRGKKRNRKPGKGPGYHAIFYGVGVTFKLPKKRALSANEICSQLIDHGLCGSYVMDGRVVVLP